MIHMKAGISVIVTTWENDGDNRKDKSVHGLNRECALAISEFCKVFKSKNTRPVGVGLGNIDRRELDVDNLDQYLPEGVAELIEKESGYTLYELFCELIGTWCDRQYVRVFDKIVFLEVPSDIHEVTL